MNELVRLADIRRYHHDRDPGLLDLSLQLATTPCGPLYGRNISPDRELASVVRQLAG